MPTLSHSLFAWNVISFKVVMVAGDNDVHIFNKNNPVSPILVVDIRDKMPLIREHD